MARALGYGLNSGISVAGKSAFLGFPALLKPQPPPPTTNKSCLSTVRFVAEKSGRTGRVAASTTKTSSTPRKPRGIMVPQRISPALEELVGVPEIARTQALKLIWAHIKSNNLQDPHDKKIIICDEKLKKIFGKDRVGFLEITGLITPHFLKSKG